MSSDLKVFEHVPIGDNLSGTTEDGTYPASLTLSATHSSSFRTSLQFRSDANGGTDSQQSVENTKLNVDFEFVGENRTESNTASGSEPPKFEVDFNQGGSGADGADRSTVEAAGALDETTKEGHDSDSVEISLESHEIGLGVSAESEEMQAELEGESRRLPEREVQRILSKPFRAKKPQANIVYGKLGMMVSEVSEESLAVPLMSPALSDLLENQHKYRAIAIRCGCELVFTRRIVVRKMVKWTRFAVLHLRGPSDAALKRFRAMLEAANSAFRQATPHDSGKPRPRLLTAEHLPDNLELAVCAERTGRSAAGWERLPLEMPQRRRGGQPLAGRARNLMLPNNAAIRPVLSYMYPQWGFQGSKPIPQTQLFQSAVETAEQLEKQQNEEMRKASISSALSNLRSQE